MKRVYRSEDGVFLGVCRGLEEALGIKARYWRMILIGAALLLNPWVILGAYLLAALLMPSSPDGEWRIRENLDNLGRDARRWSSREYREFTGMMNSLRRTKDSEYPEQGN